MKVQSDLNLCGFELQNFCVQSYTTTDNIEQALAKMLFINGNENSEFANRLVINDGYGWKGLAYMKDIEAITNGEGSLGTRVKALEDMLGLEDVTDVIDTWNDVKEFFANVDEGLTLMDLLNSKLDKTGGTIKGNLIMAEGHVVTRELYAGADNTYDLGNSGRRWANIHTVLINGGTPIHSGNVGDYAVLKDGSNASGTWGINISGSAAKLKTAVSLWGNEFDGTQSLSGSIVLTNNNHIRIKDTLGADCSVIGITNGNNLMVGGDMISASRTYNTYLYGYNIYFRTGANQTAMTIYANGKVVVGTNYAPAHSNCLLFTPKRIHGGTAIASYTLGDSPSYGLTTGNVNEYGLYLYTTGDSQGHIQATRFDGTATAYALNLNPLGGAVNIASANATTNVLGQLNVGSSTLGHINMVGSGVNYLWADNVMHIGLSTVGGRSGDNATLTIRNDSIHSGFRNNAVSLGTSSYRWSNVYSVNGDFSGRVLIGGAEDDENYKLITNGAVKIGRSNTPNTYLGVTITDTLATFDGVDTSDGFMHYSFRSHNNELLYLSGRNNGTSVFRTIVEFDNKATFYGGALIPTGQTLTIGSVTFRETAAGEVEVDGNLHTTGTLASGGKAAEGEGDTGGSGNANVYSDVLEGVITQEWEVGNPFQKEDVIVSLYMWNTDESRWEMVLADIGVTSENIWVTFGRPTSTTDKYMAVVMG